MLHCQHTVLQGLNFKAIQLWGFCLISAFHLHNRKLSASKYTDYACFSHFLILLLSFLHLALFKSVQNGSQHLRSAILLKEQYAWWLTSKETRCGGKEFAFLIRFFFLSYIQRCFSKCSICSQSWVRERKGEKRYTKTSGWQEDN